MSHSAGVAVAPRTGRVHSSPSPIVRSFQSVASIPSVIYLAGAFACSLRNSSGSLPFSLADCPHSRWISALANHGVSVSCDDASILDPPVTRLALTTGAIFAVDSPQILQPTNLAPLSLCLPANMTVTPSSTACGFVPVSVNPEAVARVACRALGHQYVDFLVRPPPVNAIPVASRVVCSGLELHLGQCRISTTTTYTPWAVSDVEPSFDTAVRGEGLSVYPICMRVLESAANPSSDGIMSTVSRISSFQPLAVVLNSSASQIGSGRLVCVPPRASLIDAHYNPLCPANAFASVRVRPWSTVDVAMSLQHSGLAVALRCDGLRCQAAPLPASSSTLFGSQFALLCGALLDVHCYPDAAATLVNPLSRQRFRWLAPPTNWTAFSNGTFPLFSPALAFQPASGPVVPAYVCVRNPPFVSLSSSPSIAVALAETFCPTFGLVTAAVGLAALPPSAIDAPKIRLTRRSMCPSSVFGAGAACMDVFPGDAAAIAAYQSTGVLPTGKYITPVNGCDQTIVVQCRTRRTPQLAVSSSTTSACVRPFLADLGSPPGMTQVSFPRPLVATVSSAISQAMVSANSTAHFSSISIICRADGAHALSAGVVSGTPTVALICSEGLGIAGCQPAAAGTRCATTATAVCGIPAAAVSRYSLDPSTLGVTARPEGRGLRLFGAHDPISGAQLPSVGLCADPVDAGPSGSSLTAATSLSLPSLGSIRLGRVLCRMAGVTSGRRLGIPFFTIFPLPDSSGVGISPGSGVPPPNGTGIVTNGIPLIPLLNMSVPLDGPYLTKITCQGDESNVADCPHLIGSSECSRPLYFSCDAAYDPTLPWPELLHLPNEVVAPPPPPVAPPPPPVDPLPPAPPGAALPPASAFSTGLYPPSRSVKFDYALPRGTSVSPGGPVPRLQWELVDARLRSLTRFHSAFVGSCVYSTPTSISCEAVVLHAVVDDLILRSVQNLAGQIPSSAQAATILVNALTLIALEGFPVSNIRIPPRPLSSPVLVYNCS